MGTRLSLRPLFFGGSEFFYQLGLNSVAGMKDYVCHSPSFSGWSQRAARARCLRNGI
jgi:hypothetical protein